MAGEKVLSTLLESMSPSLDDGQYVFVSLDDHEVLAQLAFSQKIKGLFVEKEGVTVILEAHIADQFGINYDGVFSCITLNVDSSLDAVGLTAAVSTALANRGISANVVAAYYHDHIFVAAKHAEQAVETLESLSATHTA